MDKVFLSFLPIHDGWRCYETVMCLYLFPLSHTSIKMCIVHRDNKLRKVK